MFLYRLRHGTKCFFVKFSYFSVVFRFLAVPILLFLVRCCSLGLCEIVLLLEKNIQFYIQTSRQKRINILFYSNIYFQFSFYFRVWSLGLCFFHTDLFGIIIAPLMFEGVSCFSCIFVRATFIYILRWRAIKKWKMELQEKKLINLIRKEEKLATVLRHSN